MKKCLSFSNAKSKTLKGVAQQSGSITLFTTHLKSSHFLKIKMQKANIGKRSLSQ